jgi:hypothetical protein
MLGFLPVHREASFPNFSIAPSYLTRPLGVAAVGFDFRLSQKLALRAEYRGLLYKFPDNHGSYGRAVTETSQPTLSLVYRFGGRR